MTTRRSSARKTQVAPSASTAKAAGQEHESYRGRVTTIAESWDWLTPEDVVRHALGAYYLACRRAEVEPIENSLPGEGKYPPSSWTSRETFAEDVKLLFSLKVEKQGFEKFGFPYLMGAAEALVFFDPANLRTQSAPNVTVAENSISADIAHCRHVARHEHAPSHTRRLQDGKLSARLFYLRRTQGDRPC